MAAVIRELSESITKDLNKCDSEFEIDSKIIPRYENGQIGYTVVSVPGYMKRYEPDNTWNQGVDKETVQC